MTPGKDMSTAPGSGRSTREPRATADAGAASVRLRQFTTAADDARRAARRARIAASAALRRRAQRRRRTLVVAIGLIAALAVVAASVSVMLGIGLGRAGQADEVRAAAVDSARAAITTMLTADPAQPEHYADAVIAVSTGAQRQRLVAGRSDLVSAIAAQPQPSTGVILAAGLVDDPGPDAGTARVLLVAEASNPQLLGGDPSAKRMPIEVTMSDDHGVWKVSEAGLR